MGSDPYRYFRTEARELHEALTRGALEIERGGSAAEPVGRMLRAAHTLKGAARVVKQPRIADLAHAIEEVLAPHRDAPAPAPPDAARDVLRKLDEIAGLLARLAPPAEAAPSAAATEERFRTVRVDAADLDRLLAGLAQASSRVAGARAEHPAGPEAVLLDEAERELSQAVEAAAAMRLMPASALFASLERAVRDASQSLGRPVELRTVGGETRLDANVLAALQDALLHVARNAVVHGIEGAAERSAAGKPAAGQVEIRVERDGGQVRFSCRDDGRGVDVEAVRQAAARRGLRPPGELAALGPEHLLKLILKGGVSTSPTTTPMAGRGIGLDVVRDAIARLRGDVSVRTAPGRGTTFELRVPFTLSSIPALLVEGGGVTCALPLDSVRAALRLEASEIARSEEGASIVHEGAALPYMPLGVALERPAEPRTGRRVSAVVVTAGGRGAAIGVDRVLGAGSVTLSPIPPWAEAKPVVAGASLDPAGRPRLVLDAAALAAAAGGSWRDADPDAPKLPLLVVDDSLTTRMLEQSILESAGYEVELAVSGEEALSKARGRRYAMMLVDVEMPGMDGFELIRRARLDPALRDVPAILVTSRSGAEDRRQGEEAGAQAFVAKGDFDQKRLLQIIRELVG